LVSRDSPAGPEYGSPYWLCPLYPYFLQFHFFNN
jgi:hypothetical protein